MKNASDVSCMDALQLAGKIIMENGGETYRAEETINRMGRGFGLEQVDSFAVPSGLFISYKNEDGEPVTSVRRVRKETRNLTRVDEVNQVSRLAAAGKLDCSQALARLREIECHPGSFAGMWCLPAAFLCAAGFALLFGADLLSIAAAGVVALLVQLMETFMARFRSRGMAASILGGLLTTLLPLLLSRVLPALQTELIVAGAVMPLVPGLAMTTAVQDTMRGDMVSGISHGVQAVLTACLIAGAVLGAFFGTVGFAMLVHTPKRAWFVSGLIASLSYLLYWLVTYLGLPDPMAIFIGSLFGSLVGLLSARLMKIIGTVFLMSAVVPVVPGLGLYRMMAALGQGQLAAGAKTGVQAMITVAMIALGLGAGAFADRILWSRRPHHET